MSKKTDIVKVMFLRSAISYGLGYSKNQLGEISAEQYDKLSKEENLLIKVDKDGKPFESETVSDNSKEQIKTLTKERDDANDKLKKSEKALIASDENVSSLTLQLADSVKMQSTTEAKVKELTKTNEKLSKDLEKANKAKK